MAFASTAVGSSFFVLELGGTNIELEAHSVGLVLYAVGRLIVFAMFFSSIGKMFGYKYYGLLELGEQAGVFKKVSTRYEMPDGSKVFGK